MPNVGGGRPGDGGDQGVGGFGGISGAAGKHGDGATNFTCLRTTSSNGRDALAHASLGSGEFGETGPVGTISGDAGHVYLMNSCSPDNCDVEGYHWSCSLQRCVRNSPVLIDIQGDGFELTDAANGVDFNFSNDGLERMGWTTANSDEKIEH